MSRSIVELGIYPAVDPLESTSRILDPRIVGKEHYETAAEYLRQADALGPLSKLLERELCQAMELASRELQDYKTAYEYAARQLKL